MLHQNAMRDLVGERDTRTVRSAAGVLSEQVYHRASSVHSLALRASEGVNPASLLTMADFMLSDFDGGLATFTPEGKLLAASGENNIFDRVPTDFLIDLLRQAGAEPVFSPLVTISPTGTSFVLVVALVENSQVVVGAFSPAAVSKHALGDLWAPGDHASTFVVDEKRRLLYQAGALVPAIPIAQHPGASEALQGKSGVLYIQAEHGEHIVAFSPIAPIGWALVIEEHWEAAAGPMLHTTQLAPLILVPVLLLALVALWFGARQIVQPLQALEAKAAELAWGRYEAIEQPVNGIEEIRRLQTELAHMSRKVRAAQDSLHGYIGAITAGQEEERRRLARELHDDTLQALIALNQRLQLASLTLADSQAAESLAEIQALTEQTIANLRRFTQALRPIYLEELGLAAALEMLTREVSQAANLPVEFRLLGMERRLLSEVELALYRMAQEALNNVTHHAQASHASLTISFAQAITLTVSDDGRGFTVPESPAEFAPGGHFGLLGLHERAELIGARLDIQSTPGKGTQLSISLPAL
ncbi:MAG: hypothetical protein JW850_05945 [Thermoflexales bacterium]|nr:hypothetical protein [Thermoflexales bacterium]